MQHRNQEIWYSATDLANHLACGHLTHLDRLALDGLTKPIYRASPTLDLLVELGQRHEAKYLESLNRSQKQVTQLEDNAYSKDSSVTRNAIASGADVIYQPWLVSAPWNGRADFLMKTDQPSLLGEWSYEVSDTKLAQSTRATTIMQLCLYSELLGEIQGVMPRFMRIVKPGNPFDVETLRVQDYMAYYRFAKKRFLDYVNGPPDDRSYPEPCSHCDVCKWWSHCDNAWRSDDHLTFIAGIRKSQRQELTVQGIHQLAEFAKADKPLPARPQRGSMESFVRVHRQAMVQYKGRLTGKPEFEFESVEDGRGLLLLPEPNEADIFFDIEGIPRASVVGIEYLFGYVELVDGAYKYQSNWALTKAEEKRMFERFIKMLVSRLETNPGMHIYHYAPYEPSALKRLALQHATCEDELDQLIRSERFVDLYAVVRQSIRASVESYSIKQMEQFYGYIRSEALENARSSLSTVERLIELQIIDELLESDKSIVQRYNEDDCRSTQVLRDWLEELRTQLSKEAGDLPRPPIKSGQDSDEAEQIATNTKFVFDQLMADIQEEPIGDAQKSRWLLAHMLDYFRREEKCKWWEFYRLRDLTPDELFFEQSAIAGLNFVQEFPPTGRTRLPTHRYRFPEQEATIQIGKMLWDGQGNPVGTVVGMDPVSRTIDIKRTMKTVAIHPIAAFEFDDIRPGPLPVSLLEFARTQIPTPSNLARINSARYDLLTRCQPRLRSSKLPIAGKITDVATTIAFDLDNSYLPIQGPPGSGKTYIGSRMIRDLARSGKKIGVTAVSHKVILNVLEGVLDASANGNPVPVAHQIKEPADDFPANVRVSADKADSLRLLNEGYVVGGTAWLWADSSMSNQLDYLFIDEAGQMSLAIALAVGQAAKNIILLGDPQQLEQPQQGSHPEGSGIAALSHVLGDQATIAPNMGLFLEHTWRLHPLICQFTSEQYYDDRLVSNTGLESQRIVGTGQLAGAGLRFLSVSHVGNENRSDEEVEFIRSLIVDLTSDGYKWIDKNSISSELTIEDILVVAPYNAQVQALKNALPFSAKVGTVDKFQGQESPVVIYSMTSSSAEDAPRGMSFLFSRNRMNVATSRAKCLAIIVASERLLAPSCNSPDSIRLANGLCRFWQLAN
jgi:predicted RecB family nuclease